MRQAVEAQVLNPHCELGEHGQYGAFNHHECLDARPHTLCVCAAGLRQILSDVIDEVRQSVSQDIDGAEILHSLLNAAWLQSLLKVR